MEYTFSSHLISHKAFTQWRASGCEPLKKGNKRKALLHVLPHLRISLAAMKILFMSENCPPHPPPAPPSQLSFFSLWSSEKFFLLLDPFSILFLRRDNKFPMHKFLSGKKSFDRRNGRRNFWLYELQLFFWKPSENYCSFKINVNYGFVVKFNYPIYTRINWGRFEQVYLKIWVKRFLFTKWIVI